RSLFRLVELTPVPVGREVGLGRSDLCLPGGVFLAIVGDVTLPDRDMGLGDGRPARACVELGMVQVATESRNLCREIATSPLNELSSRIGHEPLDLLVKV